MLSNLKFITRSLKRQRSFTIINIIGLSLGMMSCSFIFLYVYHSLTFDQYHHDIDQIFRVNSEWVSQDPDNTIAVTPQYVAPSLENEYSFVTAAARISLINKVHEVARGEEKFFTKNIRIADPAILKVFRFDWIETTGENPLFQPEAVVINESLAQKIFGSTDCLHENLSVDGKRRIVTGVYKDWPQNIDLPVNGVIAGQFPDSPDLEPQYAYYTYVKANNQSQLIGALQEISENVHQKMSGLNPEGTFILHKAQALSGLHFDESITMDTPKGNKVFVYLFLASGIILLFIILINVSNMSMIKSVDDAPKTSIRKILGADRIQLVIQYLMELSLVYWTSWIISATLFQLTSDYFTQLSGITIEFHEFTGMLIFLSLAFYLLVLLAGSYPVFLLVSIPVADSLKKRFTFKIPGNQLRKALLTFQFIISGVLISGLAVLLSQWSYIKNKDLGFSTKDVIVISLKNDDLDLEPILHDLRNFVGEEKISLASWGALPGSEIGFSTVKFNESHTEINVNTIGFDDNFLEILGLPILQGEYPAKLSREVFQAKSDINERPSRGVLINQTLANMLDNPIQQSLNSGGWMKGHVTGIIPDYHYLSLHNKIGPLMVYPQEMTQRQINHIMIKSPLGKAEEIRAILNNHWSPQNFELQMLDQKLMDNYTQEQEAISMIQYFTFLSIFIATLGLFGIMAYMLKRRLYEIGIRKVLGAHTLDLIKLFGKEILYILGVATLITFPLSVLLKNKLFGMYAFTPDFSNAWLIFPLVTGVMLSFFVIVIQISISTRTNPSKLLRDE